MDPTVLRYTLVVHTSGSPLNAEECVPTAAHSILFPENSRCTALVNAAKKQYGLHIHLLNLTLARPEGPTPLFPLPPRVLPAAAHMAEEFEVRELPLAPEDVAQVGRFVREFVVMSLIPWMERCVLDWNEVVRVQRCPTLPCAEVYKVHVDATAAVTPLQYNTSSVRLQLVCTCSPVADFGRHEWQRHATACFCPAAATTARRVRDRARRL